jgi:hypothetical protein
MRVAGEDYAYARRTFSTRGAPFHMILCNEKEIADAMEEIAAMRYSIENALPPSKQN